MVDPFGNSFSASLRWRFNPHLLSQPRATASDSSAEDNKKTRKKFRFPAKAAATAGVLALLGDTAAQLRSHWIRRQQNSLHQNAEEVSGDKSILESYDWLRALRMSTYGCFIYGPGSHVWYSFLDRVLWEKTLRNLSLKVLLNQIVLGPCVIAVIFAWNSLWQGKLDKLPALYADHAVPTLVGSSGSLPVC